MSEHDELVIEMGDGAYTVTGSGADRVLMRHVDDLPWHDAPIPRRWHFCRAQTIGYLGVLGPRIERCACGAIRTDNGRWHEQNGRKPR